MGIDNVYGTGSLRPGVCTSTSRPGSPFEGQTIYETDTDLVRSYNGSSWVTIGPTATFNASTTITATNASWPVPTLKSPIVRVTAIGAGGGGGGGNNSGAGGNGGNTTFNAGSAGTVTGTGGTGGVNGPPSGATTAQAATAGTASNNGGTTPGGNTYFGSDGSGGQITVAYLNLTGISTVNVTIGAGGSGSGSSSAGGRGEVIVEYAS